MNQVGVTSILAVFITPKITIEYCDRIWKLFSNYFNENSINYIMVDGCDWFLSYFASIEKHYLICKFHFIKNIKKHLPNNQQIKNKIMLLIYKMCNSKNENEFQLEYEEN